MALILVFVLLAGFSRGEEPKPKPKPPHPVRMVGPEYEPCAMLGRVESLSPDRVTIKPQGQFGIRGQSFYPDGSIREEYVYIQDNTKPARAFVFGDSLRIFSDLPVPAARRVGLNHPARSREHKITDLQVGDVVMISYSPGAARDVCMSIRIQRRPGGRVPDAYQDEDAGPRSIAVQRNSEQFVEETIAGRWGPRLLAALAR